MNLVKKFFLFLIFPVALYCIASVIYTRINQRFSLAKIELEIPYQPEWDLSTKEERAHAMEILAMPFHYLGKGRQSYAFESEDGKYILKFMKVERLSVHPIYSLLPLTKERYNKKVLEKKKRRAELFQSYLLAKKELQNESGIFFIHLCMDSHKLGQVSLTDKQGVTHRLALDRVPFIIQKKAEPFLPLMKKLWREGKKEEVKLYVFQLVDLMKDLSKRGLRDADQSLIAHNNVGIADGKVCYIDIGTFKKVTPDNKKLLAKDYKGLKPIHNWLKKEDKEFANQFLEAIKQKIDE